MTEHDDSQLTNEEWQLIQILREQQEESRGFRLVIEHIDGAWDVAMTLDARSTRGVGKTFEQAWGNDRPSGKYGRDLGIE